jgi:hypothetical protein
MPPFWQYFLRLLAWPAEVRLALASKIEASLQVAVSEGVPAAITFAEALVSHLCLAL